MNRFIPLFDIYLQPLRRFAHLTVPLKPFQ